MAEASFPCPHETDPDIFRESLSYSEGVTGFTASLIEKDYYCSLILHHLFDRETPLVFKGRTCLSKVYADFYRLSEDLDLVIPVSVDIPRNQRRSKMDPMKGIFDELPAVVPGISVSSSQDVFTPQVPLDGHGEVFFWTDSSAGLAENTFG